MAWSSKTSVDGGYSESITMNGISQIEICKLGKYVTFYNYYYLRNLDGRLKKHSLA